MKTGDWLKSVKFSEPGLVPAIVQDIHSGDVLMLAYMNRESLEKTLQTGMTHFWSRSRKGLWQKGESSGNVQKVKAVCLDCDGDALLIQVEQTRVACHTGRWSCFHQRLSDGWWIVVEDSPRTAQAAHILDRVYQVILDRKENPKKDSYVGGLMKGGKDRILKKIGEEAGELIIGSKNENREEIISEMADLWFHALVLLGYHGITPEDLYGEFRKRFGKPGIKSKGKGGK